MKRLLLFLFLASTLLSTKAQWVSIPDSNFGYWLTQRYPSCMQGNAQAGYQMDTTCSAILMETNFWCTFAKIENIEGVQYFKALQHFDCSYNKIHFIPPLTAPLIDLYCDYNQLSTLPNLPPNLSTLFCFVNQITALPNLPNSLTDLNCSGNQLTNLPALPNSLKRLDCSENQFNLLPNLPVNLKELNCKYNKLSTLILPSSLEILYIRSNLFTSLPVLPLSLTYLDCGVNPLQSISQVTTLVSLKELHCYTDQLTSLPNLPSSLTYLTCSGNQLTSLPTLPASLTTLWCVNNQITSLPSLPNSLKQLWCGSNQLTSLPSLPVTLTLLQCYNNKLTTLPDLPDSLYYLYCYDNPNLSCFPELKKVVDLRFYNTSIKCLPNYPLENTYITPSVPLCNLISPCPVYWNITGNAHRDTVASCLLDSLYPASRLHNLKVNLFQSGVVKQQMYLTTFGEYSFDTDSFTTYQVAIDTLGLPIRVKCPNSGVQTVQVTAADSLKYNVNFGIECLGNDVGVNAIYSRFRAGRVSGVSIHAGDLLDVGCASGPAIVITTISGSAKYKSPAASALTPTTVVGNVLTYNIADISNIHASSDFNILVQTDTNTAIGSSICITTAIHTPTPDYNSSNDALTICFPVVNSYDPNEKTVYPSSLSQDATWLNYTINFQNTGNDTAYDIIVRDTLDNNLQTESFQYVASSHSPFVQVIGKQVVFTFANINLLDSFHNEPKSHGWVQFRIKTKPNLPINTSIPNTSYIYFDFNPPIQTNTAITTVQFCSPSLVNLYDTICDGAIKLFNGVNLTQTGLYYDTLKNKSGCDSSITLHLFVRPISNQTIYDTICNGDSKLFNGNQLTSAGVYYDTLINLKGCDSTLQLKLAVKNSPAVPVVVHNGNRLYTPAVANHSYQWLRNAQAISGANDTSYILAQNGTYSVDLTAPNSCTTRSLDLVINNVGLEEITQETLLLYPNPNMGSFTLEAPQYLGKEWQVLDVLGRVTASGRVESEHEFIQLPNVSEGVYMLKCGNAVLRLVVN